MTVLTRKENELHNSLIVAEFNLKQVETELRRLRKENEKLRARLAQPEQEPWGYISHRSWKMPVFVEAENLEVSGLPFNNPNYTPVYKAPPQREWQGLTDEEYEAIRAAGEFGKGSLRFKNIFNAIEAKLKEKNT